MDTEEIIAELEDQRDRLDRAIELLRHGKIRGYKTAELRRKMSEGMRKHWIERRKKMAAAKA